MPRTLVCHVKASILNYTSFNEQRDEDKKHGISNSKLPYLATKRQGEHVTITNFGLPASDRVVIKDTLDYSMAVTKLLFH